METVRNNITKHVFAPSSLAWLLWFVGLPFLAVAPILNDGPEMVAVALSGGVLHPPGFPLQSLLHQVALLLPFNTPSYALSLLSYTAHCLSAFLFFSFLSTLNLHRLWQFFLGTSFFFGGPLLFLGMQPEVFAVSHLLILCALYLWHRHEHLPRPHIFALQVSVLVGCSLAQHPITIMAAPFWLALAWRCIQHKKEKSIFAALILPATIIIVLLYGGLLWTEQNVWPSWGGLYTLQDVMHHFLRTEYGSFALQEDAHGDSANTLMIMLSHNAIFGGGVYIILSLLCLGSFFKIKKNLEHLTLFAFFILVVLFSIQATSYGDPETAFCIAYRFTAIPWIMVLTLSALFLSRVPVHGNRQKLLWTIAAFQLGTLFIHESPNIMAMRDTTLTLFHARTQLNLEPNEIYLSQSDIEAYLSAKPTPQETRFPLDISFYNKPWYRKQMQARMPEHFGQQNHWPKHVGELLYQKWKHGTRLKSAQEHLVALPETTPQLEGLLFVNGAQEFHPRLTAMERIKSHLALCEDVQQMRAVPGSPFSVTESLETRTRRFAFIHSYRYFYLRAFADAYETAREEQLPQAFLESISALIESLQTGQSPSVWQTQCQRLQETLYF